MLPLCQCNACLCDVLHRPLLGSEEMGRRACELITPPLILLCMQRLTIDGTEHIKDGVRRGVPPQRIVKHIQDQVIYRFMAERNISDKETAIVMIVTSGCSAPYTRDYWVTVKDVQNAANDHDMANWKRHPDLMTSLQMWWHGDKEHVNLLFEYPGMPGTHPDNPESNSAPGPDFIFAFSFPQSMRSARMWGNGRPIMMDSTHGTNNLGYNLTTGVVADDHGNGHPVFWAFCSSESTASLTKVLAAFDKKVGSLPLLLLLHPKNLEQDLTRTHV